MGVVERCRGDLGAPHSPLLPEPQPPKRADVLVLESTYGDSGAKQALKAVIERWPREAGHEIRVTHWVFWDLNDYLNLCRFGAVRFQPWACVEDDQ